MNDYSLNHVKFLHGGKEFFNLLVKLIDNATDSIHLQTYIFNDDTTGNRVADALIRAAGRKVHIYMLLDGYASQGLPEEFINRLKKQASIFGSLSLCSPASTFILEGDFITK